MRKAIWVPQTWPKMCCIKYKLVNPLRKELIQTLSLRFMNLDVYLRWGLALESDCRELLTKSRICSRLNCEVVEVVFKLSYLKIILLPSSLFFWSLIEAFISRSLTWAPLLNLPLHKLTALYFYQASLHQIKACLF